jgi:hypothetical protein
MSNDQQPTEAEMIAYSDEEDRNLFGMVKTGLITLKSAYLIFVSLKAAAAWSG